MKSDRTYVEARLEEIGRARRQHWIHRRVLNVNNRGRAPYRRTTIMPRAGR